MASTKQNSIWQLLWRMILYAPKLYVADSLLWMFIMGLPAVPGLIIREFFNSLTHQSQVSSSPQTLIALLLAIGLGRIVAIFVGRITKTQHRFTISSLVRRNLLQQLLHRPGAEPLKIGDRGVSPGEVISFFREDVAQVEDNVVGTNEIAGAGLFALVSLVILLTVNVTLTLLVFLPLVAITLIVQYAETRIKRYRSASREATQHVTGLIGEMFASVQAIQVAGAEPVILDRLRLLSDQRRQQMVQDQVFTTVIHSSLENLVNLGTGLILLVAAQFRIASTDPTFNVGDFALFMYYLAFVTDFLWFMGGFLTLTKQTEVALARMEALLGQSNGVERIVEYAPLYLPDLWGRMPKLPMITQTHRETPLKELSVLHLTYQYPGSDRGITDINLTLKRGSLTVVTGRVGSGKTTLLRVLLGLLPRQSGEIYWNGCCIESPDRFFVPPRSAYMPQVPHLFSNTLRENLQLGLDCNAENLEWAISLAEFSPDLATMPEGLETMIGPKGMRLSGGQIQRAAAARMFIKHPELLVIDDLSSAIDIETEQKLWSRLFKVLSLHSSDTASYTPTCLIVSHRPSVLQRADQIIVLNHGRIEAQGKPDDLQRFLT